MTECAGCGRNMTPLAAEPAVWRCGDGTIYGWCCWDKAAKHIDRPKEKKSATRRR